MTYDTEEEVRDAVEKRLENIHGALLDGFDPDEIASEIVEREGLPVDEAIIEREV